MLPYNFCFYEYIAMGNCLKSAKNSVEIAEIVKFLKPGKIRFKYLLNPKLRIYCVQNRGHGV